MTAHSTMLNSEPSGLVTRTAVPRWVAADLGSPMAAPSAAPVVAPVVAPNPAPVVAPRTAAGVKAARRRRARLAGVRGPASGLLPSSNRTSAVVTADHGDQIAERGFGPGRWVRLGTSLSLVAAAVIVTVSLVSTGTTRGIAEVTVGAGDSLWSIAQHAQPGADPRLLVEQIKRLNSLHGDAVMIGAVLEVPTAGG